MFPETFVYLPAWMIDFYDERMKVFRSHGAECIWNSINHQSNGWLSHPTKYC